MQFNEHKQQKHNMNYLEYKLLWKIKTEDSFLPTGSCPAEQCYSRSNTNYDYVSKVIIDIGFYMAINFCMFSVTYSIFS